MSHSIAFLYYCCPVYLKLSTDEPSRCLTSPYDEKFGVKSQRGLSLLISKIINVQGVSEKASHFENEKKNFANVGSKSWNVYLLFHTGNIRSQNYQNAIPDVLKCDPRSAKY